MTAQRWTVYLSGEIHTDWRQRIESGVRQAQLPVDLLSPVTDHGISDDCGVRIPVSYTHLTLPTIYSV